MSPAAEMFLYNICQNVVVAIIFLLLPLAAILLSLLKKKIWGLLPSFMLGGAIAALMFLALFDEHLFKTQPFTELPDHPYPGMGTAATLFLILFLQLGFCLALFFAVYYGSRALASRSQSRLSFKRYMKFKREQDKLEGKNT